MESETPSLVEDEDLVATVAVGAGTANDNRGKHRILAELKRLEQELKSLEVFFCFLIIFSLSHSPSLFLSFIFL